MIKKKVAAIFVQFYDDSHGRWQIIFKFLILKSKFH